MLRPFSRPSLSFSPVPHENASPVFPAFPVFSLSLTTVSNQLVSCVVNGNIVERREIGAGLQSRICVQEVMARIPAKRAVLQRRMIRRMRKKRAYLELGGEKPDTPQESERAPPLLLVYLCQSLPLLALGTKAVLGFLPGLSS